MTLLKRVSPRNIGFEPYLHLVWLVFLISQPIFDPESTWLDWVAIPAIVAVFLPVYLWGWTGGRRTSLLSIAGMSLLGLLLAPINAGAQSFFIYASAAAGFSARPRAAVAIIAGILLLVPLSSLFVYIPWPWRLYYVVPIAIMVCLIGVVNIFEGQKMRAGRKLRQAHSEIEQLAKIAERERIARDLHDLLGHTLSVITLKSELAARLAQKDPERAEREMKDVETISREALSEVRTAVSGYRARGLFSEVAGAKRALAGADIDHEFDVDSDGIPPALESTLALALREAITNVVRHSGAGRCRVELHRDGKDLVLRVADDGRGSRGAEGSGLQGMRERVEALGGGLALANDGGAVLTVTLPLEPGGQRTEKPRTTGEPAAAGATGTATGIGGNGCT